MSIFKRLLRDNASSVDRPGVDEFSPPNVDRLLYPIAHDHVPMNTHNAPATRFFGDLGSPTPQGPPRPLATDSPPLLLDTHYARARHGEGLWGVEPLIPEGDTML